MASSDSKLDEILANSRATSQDIKLLNSKFDRLESKVSDLQAPTSSHGQSITELQAEVAKLKEAGNARDQEARSKVIRVFNLPTSEDEAANSGKILSAKVYEKVLKPILTAAKAKGDIATLPQQNTLIEECFRLRGPGSGPPPPVIVKLTSHMFKTAVMRNKRDNIPAPPRAELSGGARPCFVVEDLTPATHQRMMELKEDKRVAKIWTVDGQIRLTLVSSPDTVVKLKSPYADCERILSKK